MVDIKQRQVNCFLPIPKSLFYRKMNVICIFFPFMVSLLVLLLPVLFDIVFTVLFFSNNKTRVPDY